VASEVESRTSEEQFNGIRIEEEQKSEWMYNEEEDDEDQSVNTEALLDRHSSRRRPAPT
jgi:hypothetical protein